MPRRVLAVYASRPGARVTEAVYDTLDAEHRVPLTLEGLASADVRALLWDAVSKYRLQADYVEAVLDQSEGNPLYLKLLCDGLYEGDYRLNDAASLPRGMAELYDTLLRRFSTTDGAWDVLHLLTAARGYVSPAMIAEVLEAPPSRVEGTLLPAVAEALHENPWTEALEDYQLFHESLRGYLRARHGHHVARQDERLAEWCLGWRQRRGEMRAYALRHAVPHLLGSRAAALEEGDEAAANARLEQCCALLDDDAYREQIFRTCGNAVPLQGALSAVQRLLAEQDGGSGAEIERIVRYARLFHEEAHRLYGQQLEAVDACAGAAEPSSLEPLAELAGMGATPRDRVILLLRGLWPPDSRPRLPAAVRAAAEKWVEDASSESLRALWAMLDGSGNGREHTARS
jgi:hypothetical protein